MIVDRKKNVKTSQVLADAIVLLLFQGKEKDASTIAEKLSGIDSTLSLEKSKVICWHSTSRLRGNGFIQEVRSTGRRKLFRLTDAGRCEVKEISEILRKIL
jgi:DNA-binding PadR family transcriptional regulator